MAFLRRLRRKPRADTAGTGSALLPAKKKKRIWHSYETDNCKKKSSSVKCFFYGRTLWCARNLYWTTTTPHTQAILSKKNNADVFIIGKRQEDMMIFGR